ncbi:MULTISPECIES: hypothetical protein [Enterobacteriaceae]|uniref:hypothetical protein n=1 Tax=Enterobacteriaceae TaxID=543 RepID=UPI0012F4A8B9|nr:hypothetical protein [Enterobacter sp. Ag1]
MNNRRYLMMISFLVFLLIVVISVGGLRRYHANHFSCNGVYSVSYNDVVLHANARMTFSGSEGTAVLSGVLESDSTKVSNIVISTMFDVKRVKESFVLTATKNTVELSDEKEKIERILPEFYYNKGSSVIYDILPQGDDYLFLRGGIPVFFCKR